MSMFLDFLIEDYSIGSWFPKSEKEIKLIITAYRENTVTHPHTSKIENRKFPRYSINSDFSINIPGKFKLTDAFLNKNGRVPIKLNHVGEFTVTATGLTSLIGFPTTVYSFSTPSNFDSESGVLFIGFQRFITNLEGYPRFNYGDVELTKFLHPNFTITKLNNIISLITGHIFLPKNYSGPLLSLLYIKGLKGISTTWSAVYQSEKQHKAYDIINKYFDNGNGHGILDCQEELISAGLKEFAKL